MPQEVPKLNLAQLSIIGARSKHRQGFGRTAIWSRETIQAQEFQQGTKGLSAMAMRPPGLIVDLRHGAVEGRQIKERIVSEATAAPRSGEDAPFDRSLRGQQRYPILGSGQRTAVAGAAFTVGNPAELL